MLNWWLPGCNTQVSLQAMDPTNMTTNFSSMKASGKMVKNMVRLSILHVYNNGGDLKITCCNFSYSLDCLN